MGRRDVVIRSGLAMMAIALSTLLGTFLTASSARELFYRPQKVIYHNNGRGSESAGHFEAILKNLSNHMKAVGQGRLDAQVVSHGDGVLLFQLAAQKPELARTLDDLKANGGRFLVCRNTLNERGIDWHSLYGVAEADIVPIGIARLVYLQQQGYSYAHP